MKTAIAVLTMMCVVSPLQAQWLKSPTSGVPRKADGSPDLNAPAPRAADGKPDLSGIWDIEHNRPCPAGGCNDMEIGQEFVDVGWGLKGGLPYQPWAAAIRKERMDKDGKDDPASRCLPGGIVKGHTTPLLSKIIQLPGLLLILNERNATYRQIFTDGRPLPAINLPSENGFSTATWDGDVLVVQTTGFTDGVWLDRSGSPLTDAATITERFRRVNYGKLEIAITVDDPKAYTAPWTVTLNHFIVLDTELVDYICLENEKDAARVADK
jgi:hypothetical protein